MDSTMVVSLVAFLAIFQGAYGWGYFGNIGPAHWKDTNAVCGSGSRQSPVDLKSPSYMKIAPFTFTNYNSAAGLTYSLINNGHTVKMNVAGSSLPKVTAGGLPAEYTMAQLHFHWGATNTVGSEHTIGGTKFPMEMHIVNYKSSYGSLGSSLSYDDGLAVLGFMFQVDNVATEHPGMKKLIDYLTQVTAKDASHNLSTFPIQDLMPSKAVLDDFYRYNGSLTTPPCTEVVTWTVFTSTIKITPTQLAEFRKLQSAETNNQGNTNMVDNYRPVVALGSRTLYSSFQASSGFRPSAPLSAILLAFIIKQLL